MTQKLRQELIATALEMNRCGINRGTSGNLSVRSGDGMLITPSGLPYDRLTAADIVYVEAGDGAPPRFDGPHKPSSEWRIHRDVYRARPDALAILVQRKREAALGEIKEEREPKANELRGRPGVASLVQYVGK